MLPLQEKLQTVLGRPKHEDDPKEWSSFESARDLNAAQNNDPVDMPPGMDIRNQDNFQLGPMPCSLAGESDVSKDANKEAMLNGFSKKSMRGADDQYMGEHVDHFYGDSGGFAERNNYLDRI